MITIAEPKAGAAELQVIDIDGEEILAAFAEVMHEWGHARTAEGLRFPTLEEARRVAAGRHPCRGWNVSPLPECRITEHARDSDAC